IFKQDIMLIIRVRENENIDKALRRYKKKIRNTGIHNEVRKRAYYTKPSKANRLALEKAKYRQQMLNKWEV
ncbi:MAG: 30S ribosomal protein S21, partial [Bacteroidota bacterium]